MLDLGRRYVVLESQRDELLEEVRILTKGKDDEARQADFLRAELQKSNEALEKLKKDLQSKDAAFKEEKEHLEIPLRAVADSLIGASGVPVKLTGRIREDALDQAVASVQAASAPVVSLVARSQDTLKRLLTTLTPGAKVPSTPQALLDAFEAEDDPVDQFSEKKAKSVFVSLVTLMMAHSEKIDLEKVTSSIPISSSEPVNPRAVAKQAKKYGDKLYDVLAMYRVARKKATAGASSSAATKAQTPKNILSRFLMKTVGSRTFVL